MIASEKPDSRDNTKTIGSVTNMRKGRIQVVRISCTLKRSLNVLSSFGPQMLFSTPFFSPSARRFLAMRSRRMVVRVSGTKMAWAIWTAPPKISCIQMFHLQARNSSTKPPTIGPRTEPPTEEKTMNATAYCWLSLQELALHVKFQFMHLRFPHIGHHG